MHGKTQVFPLPASDVTHTRLTHSLEVSCVGRSLGALAAATLEKQGAVGLPDGFAEVVAAASLAHDIGNPPFGHSGEAAIGEFFRSTGNYLLEHLPAESHNDFLAFEGNAMGFRLLARTPPRRSTWPGGMQLTYAVLGAFSKYPKGSNIKGRDGMVSEKKYGYFTSEAATFADVASKLGLVPRSNAGWSRHPLAFLMEAADDICYRVIDLEDAYRRGIVGFEETSEYLSGVANQPPRPVDPETFAGILAHDERIAYLRAKAINNLIHQCAQVFADNGAEIMSGGFDKPLTDLIPARDALKKVRDAVQEKVYPHRPVLQIETAGFRILDGLLEDFIGAAWDHPTSKRSAKVLSLLPAGYRAERADNAYECVMSVTEYVACMTDGYAIDTYRVLRGMELPLS
jgi:dGTPase